MFKLIFEIKISKVLLFAFIVFSHWYDIINTLLMRTFMSELEQDYTSQFKSQSNRTNKFKVFRYMIHWFSFIYQAVHRNTEQTFSTEEEKYKKKLYQELSHSYDEFLNSNLLNINCEMIQNGYQPTNSQYNMLMHKISEDIISNRKAILNYQQFFKNIPEELLLNWFIAHYNVYQKYEFYHEDEQGYNFLFEQAKHFDNFYEKLIDKNIFTIQKTLDYFMDNFEMTYRSIGGMSSTDNREHLEKLSKNILTLLNTLTDFHNDISLETTVRAKRCIEGVATCIENKVYSVVAEQYKTESLAYCRVNDFKQNAKLVDTIVKEHYSNHKERIINKVKMLNNGYTQSIIQLELDDKQSVKLKNDLPADVLSILKDIEEKYHFICQNQVTNPLINLYEVNNLYQKKIPDIVKKYLLIAPEYRVELKNVEGKDAKELMIESLSNVQAVFNEHYQDINELLLRDLSASQRHIKAIKNKM